MESKKNINQRELLDWLIDSGKLGQGIGDIGEVTGQVGGLPVIQSGKITAFNRLA